MPSLLYRIDPIIMAWDLANEHYVLGGASGDILKVCMAHSRAYL